MLDGDAEAEVAEEVLDVEEVIVVEVGGKTRRAHREGGYLHNSSATLQLFCTLSGVGQKSRFLLTFRSSNFFFSTPNSQSFLLKSICVGVA